MGILSQEVKVCQKNMTRGVYDIEYHCATVGSVTEEIIRKHIENQEVSGSNEIFKIDE